MGKILMNRITQLFKNKEKGLLSIYYTAGFPKLGDTLDITKQLEAGGADLVEIGIPFSDPVADGPTIQESNKQALDNGMTLKLLFEQLSPLREQVGLPVILMGYINPVLQMGIEPFCKACEQVGIDGLILPDLPMEEYLQEYKEVFDRHGLKNIFLITPQTSEERIRLIDKHTDAFIYMVSSASITGAQSTFGDVHINYFNRIKRMKLTNPVLTGFGISNPQTFEAASTYSAGAIVGSAFIKHLRASGTENIDGFIKEIKGE